jgi:hypothetical protein
VAYLPVPQSGPVFLTALDTRVRADPFGVRWTDGRNMLSTRALISEVAAGPWPILTPGCLVNSDAVGALDDRGLDLIPSLHAYIRGPGG